MALISIEVRLKGFLNGYMYSPIDGLEGVLRTDGDIPDLVVIHYVGLDIFYTLSSTIHGKRELDN